MNGSFLSINDLAPRDRREMFELFDRHFENVTIDQFEEDLDEKHWVVLLHHTGGGIRGFTTLRFDSLEDDLERCHLVTSGDTIIDPEAWGSPELFVTWLRGVLSLRDRAGGDRPLYWLLIVSGFRTYRFLPVFWRSFYPRYNVPTPPSVTRRIELLARLRYNGGYSAEAGIVRLSHPQRLRPHLAGIPEARQNDPHVAFFLKRNPGFADGDELACLTEINEGNLTTAGQRILRTVEAQTQASQIVP